MNTRHFFLALLAFALGIDASVEGSRYLTPRAMGMGGAFVTTADDRTALYGNPAGLNVFKNKAQISLPALGINYNPNTLLAGLLTGVRLGHFSNPGAIDRSFVNQLKEVEGEHIRNQLMPEADVVFKNFGIGAYGSSGLDAVYNLGIYEPSLTYSSRTDVVVTGAFSRRVTRGLSLGFGGDYIYRLEAPEITVWGHDLQKIQIGELFSNPSDTMDLTEEIKQGFGIHAGALWHLGFFRLGAVARNLAGSLGGESLEREVDFGAGYWIPPLLNRGVLERVVLACEVQDAGGEGNFWKKVHAGVEAELPMGGIRLGINQGYPTWGFNARFFVFNIEFADYTAELGQYPGHIPDHNYLLVLRLGF